MTSFYIEKLIFIVFMCLGLVYGQDECLHGQMRCVDDSSYQTCATDANNNTYWQNAQFCQSGSQCSTSNIPDTVICIEPDDCEPESMRCVGNNTYQMCNLINGTDISVWNPVQICSDNQICKVSGNVIYCVPDSGSDTDPDDDDNNDNDDNDNDNNDNDTASSASMVEVFWKH